MRIYNMKNYNIIFSSRTTPKKFKDFLLGLSKNSQNTFNHFGKINKKNIDSIVKKELKRKDKIKFLTFLNDELAGYGFLTKFEKYSKKHNCILGIVISDQHQNKGLGKIICEKMIRTAWKKNLKKIWLNVHYDNVRAFNLYKSLGFEIEGLFVADEKMKRKERHIVSMALIKNKKFTLNDRLKLCKKLEKKFKK